MNVSYTLHEMHLNRVFNLTGMRIILQGHVPINLKKKNINLSIKDTT
jgi:hypothetical protein